MPEKAPFIAAAFLLLLLAPTASACDSSCPLSHRKGHLAPWEQLVEKSFGLPAGFGKTLMTEDEWAEQKFIMAGMSVQQREDHKKKMNFALLNRAGELGITMPAIGNKRTFSTEKTMPFEYKGASPVPVN